MLALWFGEHGLSLREVPEPRPGPGEALVRVRLAGICATDLEILKGYMGFRGVPGHEFVGVVEGPAGHPLRGRRVVGEINCGCGACALCRGGLERHCPARTVLGILGRDGAFAGRLALPGRNLHEVPGGVAEEAAVFCVPLAACFEPLEQRPELARRRVLVLGDGRLGLLQAQVLREAGAEVAVLGRHPAKLALLEGLGISLFTDPAEAAAGGRWPAVVEATGSAGGFGLAFSLVAPRGLLVLKSTVAGAAALNLAPAVIGEVEVLGSRCGPFGPALAALASGRIRTAPMVHARFPLARGLEALGRAGEKGTLKVLLAP
ncbi:MAG: alcohol dehydrogenase catalytic domain-containing protein [Candidatus Tectomicrobia bacterium]|nr:alcohol dehydrogenase catalytic domain-containing protein [Candidatus Tectomicrobia bacterium]